jgi:SAM-dependent methyltransferase
MQNIYADTTYLTNNPTWHEEDSPWKAKQIARMLAKHPLPINRVAEIGCGVGEVIRQLQPHLPQHVEFSGYDISFEAILRAKAKECDNLRFFEEDLLTNSEIFDLLLVIDVFEHVPDYLSFLEQCQRKARFKIYHIPLDLHVSSVLRGAVVSARQRVGHLHYFTEELALSALADTGHRVIDCFLTNGGVELSPRRRRLRRTTMNIPRRLVGMISPRWSARLLGGYSLLVLAE